MLTCCIKLGCGSSLPSLYLLSHSDTNQVDVQDYNEQVIRFITIPNILLNTVLTVQEPSKNNATEEKSEESSESEDDEEEDEDEEDDDEEDKRIEEDEVTCDVEAEISNENIPEILKRTQARTRAFFGDWGSLPVRQRVTQIIVH